MDGGRRRGGLTPLQRQVLGFIAEAATLQGGVCVATKREIATAVGCCLETVDAAVKVLRKNGMVTIEPRHNPDGGQAANAYRIPSGE